MDRINEKRYQLTGQLQGRQPQGRSQCPGMSLGASFFPSVSSVLRAAGVSGKPGFLLSFHRPGLHRCAGSEFSQRGTSGEAWESCLGPLHGCGALAAPREDRLQSSISSSFHSMILTSAALTSPLSIVGTFRPQTSPIPILTWK